MFLQKGWEIFLVILLHLKSFYEKKKKIPVQRSNSDFREDYLTDVMWQEDEWVRRWEQIIENHIRIFF